ncbi:MAG: Gmad2 immunoglobulin-like domain-containing protein [Actinomycetota bacterium]
MIRVNADVFEAAVSIGFLDAAGNEIVRTFTTATCGTGCRGTFSKAVRFDARLSPVSFACTNRVRRSVRPSTSSTSRSPWSLPWSPKRSSRRWAVRS